MLPKIVHAYYESIKGLWNFIFLLVRKQGLYNSEHVEYIPTSFCHSLKTIAF